MLRARPARLHTNCCRAWADAQARLFWHVTFAGMLPRLHALSPIEFAELVAQFPFTRRVSGIHLHHTVNIRSTAFRGLATLEAMRRAHIERERWTDLGQHATIAPDGTIWTGRHWDRPPCSIAGHNGDRRSGPFMAVILGDFDEEHLAGAQLHAVVEAIASVQERFELAATALRFHRDLARTGCPGLLVDKRELVQHVAERHLERRRAAGGRRPREHARPFRETARVYSAALSDLQAYALPGADESPLAEPTEVRHAVAAAASSTSPALPTASSPRPAAPVAPAGRHLALCIGIDQYPGAPLAGCVADARLWAATLDDLGFQTDVLTDSAATRQRILAQLAALVDEAVEGDVLVFQFAGHGTQVPDESGDEPDRTDEALCPVDFSEGHLLVDDDLSPIMDRIGRGVNLTCFIDCCHSGTVTRLAASRAHAGEAHDSTRSAPSEQPRRIVATPALIDAHRAFRVRRPAAAVRRAQKREILFAACRPGELAWESNGQGDFTRKATRRLRDAARLATHEEFHAQLTAAFGPAPRQHPQLTCTPAARGRLLLAPGNREWGNRGKGE